MAGYKGKNKKAGSVIWAVDPFEVEFSPAVSEIQNLLEWVARAGLRLILAHVVSLPEQQIKDGRMPQLSDIESALVGYLQKISLPPGVRAQVLMGESPSRQGVVQTLLEFAQSEAAEWIVVSSHGRSGMKRLMLGSFAELLLRESACPVLFLPRRPAPADLRKHNRVLFPTDFSALAGEAFGLFLREASRQQFEIVIFHLLTFPAPAMDLGMVPAIPQNFMPEQLEWAKREGALWAAKAEKAGVKARFVLENDDVPSLSGKAVLVTALREGAKLIAMPSLSSPLTRLVAGSVAHEVFRAGSYPVWLYGPRALAVKRRTAA